MSKRILDDVAEAAAERRLAAWLYLERRTPDHVIRADDDLYTKFRTLSAQSRRWLEATRPRPGRLHPGADAASSRYPGGR